MASRALAVAAAAGVLLVVVVAVDASMNRVHHLEAQLDGNWVKVASHPFRYDDLRYASPSLATFDLNATDEVPLRVRVENGYPWGLEADVEVTVNGKVVHTGRLSAPARGEGVSAFTLRGEELFLTGGMYEPRPTGPAGERFWTPSFGARVGEVRMDGALGIREVPK